MGRAARLVGVLGFLALVQALPHIPGTPPDLMGTYPELAGRAVDAVQGDMVPFPVHVDEHIHMAFTAQTVREGTIRSSHPYTGEPFEGDFFSVGTFRRDRGFHVAMAQIHHLTGLSLPAIWLVGPAAMGATLGGLVYAATRGAPGAMASAAAVAVVPTTARFLGPGYLVSSAFDYAWIVAAIIIVDKARGGARAFLLALVVFTAFFNHVAIGSLTAVAALAALAFGHEPRASRLKLGAAIAVPLAWLLPKFLAGASDAVQATSELPYDQEVFAGPGLLFYAMALVGIASVILLPRPTTVAHRSLAAVALFCAALMAWSVATQHNNEGTYGRLIQPFLLAMAALAGHGIAMSVRAAARAPYPRWWSALRGPPISIPHRIRSLPARKLAAATILLIVMAPALAGHMADRQYRVFDAAAWGVNEQLIAAGAGPDDVFLAPPWQAPVYAALTGARPYAVLYPGDAPVRGEAYAQYVANGADSQWLSERAITLLVGPHEPVAAHARFGDGVYRILP